MVRLCLLLIGVALGAGGLSGCAFGPFVVEKSHGPYAAAVHNVDEQQLLGNIVRLRYVDSPHALEVTSIASQYELDASAEARPFFSTEAAGSAFFRDFSRVLPFGGVSASNRPTISLAPSDDSGSIRRFMTPISLETLIMLSQSGWTTSSVLRIWVDRMNGVPNLASPGVPPRDVPPDFARFVRACELLQTAQDGELMSLHADERIVQAGGPLKQQQMTAEAVVQAAEHGYEYRPSDDGESWSLVRRDRKLVLTVNPAGRNSAELAELQQLLNLAPDADDYELAVGAGVPDPLRNQREPSRSLVVTPRSSAHALFFIANGVQVPPAHQAAGLVSLSGGEAALQATEGLFRVYSCAGRRHKRPACAYAAVWYRDHWFYVDDADRASKATLMLMLQLRRLDFNRIQTGTIPALTIPVGR